MMWFLKGENTCPNCRQEIQLIPNYVANPEYDNNGNITLRLQDMNIKLKF